jgi:hypothetical protein
MKRSISLDAPKTIQIRKGLMGAEENSDFIFDFIEVGNKRS